MNMITAIKLTKQILLISFVFFLSCKKQTEVSSPPQKPLSENAFFSRAKISANQSERDLVDTIIDFCKRADDISHFSKAVMEKYGHPKWDLTLTLNNENGLKSLMVPVADTSNQVKLIIFAYQDTKDHVIFKFVGRSTPQPGLPLSTNSGKTLTKESLVGIFNALDKRVMASKIQLNSSMENVKANNTYISSLCWLITWHYDDGSVGVLNSQCSYQIIITPGIAKGGLADGQIGVVEDIQDGGGGGPGGFEEEDAGSSDGISSTGGNLSCKSFIFTSPSNSTNWQEAGVKGLQLVGDWFGPFGGFLFKKYGEIYVGIPKILANGTKVDPAQAATAAAKAANRAASIQMGKYFGMNAQEFAAIPSVLFAKEFRVLMAGFLSDEIGGGCTVSSTNSFPGTILNNADWRSSDPCN